MQCSPRARGVPPCCQPSLIPFPAYLPLPFPHLPPRDAPIQIIQGEWFDDPTKSYARRKKTQNQEMLGYYLGVWGVRVVTFMQFFGWFGAGVVQILASSSLFYSVNQNLSMR